MKKILTKIGVVAAMSTLLMAGFCDDAQVVNRNIAKDADNFKINRRIVFYNGITEGYMLTIEGKCSLDLEKLGVLRVTCLTGPSEYKRHYLGLSDNVTYFAEQTDGADVSKFFYKVTFKPTAIIPNIELR